MNINNDFTWSHVLGTGRNEAASHQEKAQKAETNLGMVAHYTVAFFESLPVIGGIISMLSRLAQGKPHMPNWMYPEGKPADDTTRVDEVNSIADNSSSLRSSTDGLNPPLVDIPAYAKMILEDTTSSPVISSNTQTLLDAVLNEPI